MAYKYDNDLEFLKYIKSEDLNNLVDLLVYDKDGEKRISESLTNSYEYQHCYPDHNKYWKLIAEEIQTFGGNSFANFFRGGGVLYREVLEDVCKSMKCEFNNSLSTKEVELELLMKVLKEMIAEMNEDERVEMLKSMDLQEEIRDTIKSGNKFTTQITLIILQAAIRQSGFLAYKMAVIVVNAVLKFLIGRGLTFAGNQLLVRGISVFAGPIGWALSSAWLAIDIASPAFRVTIPAVFEIARLRILYDSELYKN